MSARVARMAVGLAAVALLAVGGCSNGQPKVVPVSGVLLLDGKPLPKAKIEFVPDVPGLTADAKSYAFTDEQGRFTLVNVFTEQPGAVVGRHHVVVTEIPTPKEYRSQDPVVQARYAQHLAGLGNRPIPKTFAVMATAASVEVTAEPQEYRVELKRPPS